MSWKGKYIRPIVEIITTLSYWTETWAEIKFQLVQYFLTSHLDVHKAKQLKKRFVPLLVTERLKREINVIEIKHALSLQQRTLHTYILTNISGFTRLFYVYFRAMLKKIQIFFSQVLMIWKSYIICYSLILRNVISTCWRVLDQFQNYQTWSDLT